MRSARRRPRAALLVTGVSAILILSGCSSMTNSDGSESARQSAVPSPSSSAVDVDPVPELAVNGGDELFTLTATATTQYGSRLDLSMIVHSPVNWDSAEGETMIRYIANQHIATSITDPTWDSQNNVSLGVVDITATESGERWRQVSGIQLALGPFMTRDVTINLPGADLAGHFVLTGPAAGHAIVAFPAFDGKPDPSAWSEALQLYGFEAEPGLAARSDVAPSFQDCAATFTDLGLANSWVANWANPKAGFCFEGIS